jgi:transketolase C-terminal domain/subunit
LPEELRESVQAVVGGIVITVEDHCEHGGIGDAVLAGYEVRVRKLVVREIARSGKLVERYGIHASYIVDAVRG